MNAMSVASSSDSNGWQQVLDSAADETLVSLWYILFVYLAWTVGVERRQVLNRVTARLASEKKAAQKALAAVPCYHEQLLAAVGAPSEWVVGANYVLAMGTLAALVSILDRKETSNASTSTSTSTSSSDGSSSSSSSAAAFAGVQQQLAAAVPCKEALLLVLEVVLLQLYAQDLSSQDAVMAIDASKGLLCGVLHVLKQQSGTAASAEAAAALLQAVVQMLPQAVLHAAAAAGCKYLRPHADESTILLVQTLHCEYAKLVTWVPATANPGEWSVASRMC
jgi:hypothetical protein